MSNPFAADELDFELIDRRDLVVHKLMSGIRVNGQDILYSGDQPVTIEAWRQEITTITIPVFASALDLVDVDDEWKRPEGADRNPLDPATTDMRDLPAMVVYRHDGAPCGMTIGGVNVGHRTAAYKPGLYSVTELTSDLIIVRVPFLAHSIRTVVDPQYRPPSPILRNDTITKE